MDTDFDFIEPEFLDILFFQQKNLVIFPYVDLKHLHALELFTVGFNIVDLESTALYNLKEIIENETTNSYSQNPSLYLIYNLDSEKVKEVMEIKNIRCVLNTNENVSNLTNGSEFIFYNKKNKKFINYQENGSNLEFEKYLISSSENETVLLDRIQKIKITANKVFAELNKTGKLDKLPQLLRDYDWKFWEKILNFVKLYYKVELPDLSDMESEVKKKMREVDGSSKLLKDFSGEYELIVSLNKNIAKEFVQLLHEYRSQKVNSANLDLDQLYNPQKLYEYLRNHHWKKEIPEEFINKWIHMENSQYILNETDKIDFETIFKRLNIKNNLNSKPQNKNSKKVNGEREIKDNNDITDTSKPPSIKNFSEFKTWILSRLSEIEEMLR
jgi:hypothetical protein